MTHFPDSTKAAQWRQIIRRFENVGMTVERFCKQENITASSFYRWRKIVGQSMATTNDINHTPAFQTVNVTPTKPTLVIQLPSGTKVELSTANLDAVHAVLTQLLQYDAKRRGGGSTC